MLKIFIEKLREEPGAFELNVRPEELELQDETFQFDRPVRGEFEMKMINHDVEGKGTLHAHATTPCVRCLEPASLDIDVPFHEMWFRKNAGVGPEEVPFGQEEPADFSYSGDTLYPAEAFRELILAELPPLPLCRSDCRGLCPRCGANLNTEPCRCAPGAAPKTKAEAPAATVEPDWKRKLRQLKEEA